ncbi:MAG: sulfatase-like hydrolase/transferase, partial [Thermoanaerobaculia bacterium]
MRCSRILASAALLLTVTGCSRPEAAPEPASRPSILLITLDTTRADSIGPEARAVETPAFNAVASRGRRYRQAYSTVPQTLPSHASMLTGLYPGGHRIHENARPLSGSQPLVAEELRRRGYRTAAFVSSFILAKQFGLARGFEQYDDMLPAGVSERSSQETTDRAIAWLQQNAGAPRFLWVHYFDPHHPYEPPEPYRTRYRDDPYRGEIAAMDAQIARLVQAFEQSASGGSGIIIAGDHGESLGEHGEEQHGNLVYQGSMHVPLVVAGPGVQPAVVDEPVSLRRIHDTILGWAGAAAPLSLQRDAPEVVLGESMIPFLQYGWQPQVMAVEGRRKVIRAGALEIYDIVADPAESRDLGADAGISRGIRKALAEYPVPSPDAASAAPITEEDRRQLASLGYIAAETKPVVRRAAPRPRDMVHLFDDLDRASDLFLAGQYAAAIPILERITREDPYNLAAFLRIAAAQSALGRNEAALESFRKAEALAPNSADVRHYLALHYARSGAWTEATPLLERVVQESPDRIAAVEALATAREREGRLEEAIQLRQRVVASKTPTAAEFVSLGQLA